MDTWCSMESQSKVAKASNGWREWSPSCPRNQGESPWRASDGSDGYPSQAPLDLEQRFAKMEVVIQRHEEEIQRLKQQRYVRISSTCSRCNRSVETIIHCLVTCSFAVACWRSVGLYGGSPGDISFGSWLQDRFNNWDLRERQIGAMLCWAIWQDRNNKVWNGKTKSVKNVIAFANVEKGMSIGVRQLKINVDAVTFADRNKFGYGWVLRDSGGHILQSRSGSWNGCVNPALAEAFGVKEVLSWIKESKLSHVTVESDSLITVQAFRSSMNTNSPFSCCIAECKRIISNLNHVCLCFVKRSANRVAHGLARVSWLYAEQLFGGHCSE
ncbi:hypothetical protein CsatB_009207 [Cannabis sativa]